MHRIPAPAVLGLLTLAVLALPSAGSAQAPAVELVTATGVVDREPVGVSSEFSADVGVVYAWLRVTDATDTILRVVWQHGEEEWSVPLDIGGSPWRTWSTKNIPAEWAGEWSVQVLGPDGNVLASSSFTVGS